MTQLYQRSCSVGGRESTGSKNEAGIVGVAAIVRVSLIILREARQLAGNIWNLRWKSEAEMRIRLE
jgi:hypothetical protein